MTLPDRVACQVLACLLLLPAWHAAAQDVGTPPAYDAALAERVGADEQGMRRYVLVILRSGPTPVNDADARVREE